MAEGAQGGVGADGGEIPLFGPGAGSAASAGMTDPQAGMTEVWIRLRLWGLGAFGARLLVSGLMSLAVND